jgi:hypothetical protein
MAFRDRLEFAWLLMIQVFPLKSVTPQALDDRRLCQLKRRIGSSRFCRSALNIDIVHAALVVLMLCKNASRRPR